MNLLKNTKIDHSMRILKECLEIIFTREGPFVAPVYAYGVSCIIVSCYNTTTDTADCLAKCVK